MRKLQAVADRHGFSLHEPTGTLSAEQMDKLLHGTGNEIIDFAQRRSSF